jgi:PBP1b-binding outer membrane lipoprotein LpoB
MEYQMRRVLVVLILSITLNGCATYAPSVPDNYNGPIATVKDSVKTYSTKKADFFYLKAIDGNTIEDSRSRTLRVNSGRGLYMEPVVLDRNIPAKECTVTIVGRTVYAAPILALTNTVYEVSGDMVFNPEQNKTYIVKGELGKEYSAVWIEEAESKQIIGKSIEIKGSAELGIFQK